MSTWIHRGHVGAVLTLACVVLAGGAVAGHHSQTGFDPNATPIDVKGTVVEYRWRNPHVLLFWDAKDQDGKTERWVVEFASVASSLANGMKKDTFKVGEEITATCIRARAGGPVCAQARKIVRADGSPVTTAAPD
ncbi:MAG: hypothetical protein HOP16_21085 [Acidobacteria bacterium]|nr:hypothetical protein [Acidobacteriota bacterium]